MRVAEIFRSLQGEGRLTGTESIFIRASGCNLRCRYCDTPYASWTPEGDDLAVEEILGLAEELARASVPLSLRERVGVREGGAAASVGASPPPCPSSRTDTRLPPSGSSPHPGPLPEGEGEPRARAVNHVVVTGGEPMLFAELIPLCDALRRQGKHITIETAGTLYLPVACHLMSISPKLSNSIPPREPDPRWACRHEANRHAPEVIRRLAAEYDCQFKFVVDRPADCREMEEYLAEFPEIDHCRVMLMPQGTDAVELAEKARWLEPYCRDHGLRFCPRRHVEWFGSGRGR